MSAKFRISGFLLFLLLLAIVPLEPAESKPGYTKKIMDHLNVLLPVLPEGPNREITFTLKAFHGCYDWSSSQPSLLRVTAIPDEENPKCSSSAILSVLTTKPYPNVIWVTAQDKETHDLVKCETRISSVAKMETLTKLRTFDVGDYQIFEIIGYDSEGNSFSTLEGLRFEWSIKQPFTIAEFVSIQDSQISTSHTRKAIEEHNFKSDLVVARGHRPGQILVQTRLNERNYSSASSEVTVHVIEEFLIFPDHHVFVAPLCSFIFDLYTYKNSQESQYSLSQVTLPSSNYRWSIKERTASSTLSNSGAFVCGNYTEQVTVHVQDTTTVINTVENTVTIVEPYLLDIQIKEHDEESWFSLKPSLFGRGLPSQDAIFENVWTLVKGRSYYVRLNLFDKLGNKIHITPNMEFSATFDPKHFRILHQKQFEWVVEPTSTTTMSEVKAKLLGIKGPAHTRDHVYWRPSSRNIEAYKHASVVLQVKLIRPDLASVHLPLVSGDTTVTSQQSFKLTALGGSGFFEWTTTTKTGVIAISQDGVIVPKTLGRGEVIVRDSKNPKNNDTIKVEISKLEEVVFVEKMKEILVNETGSVLVYGVGGSNQRRYSNCSFLDFSFDDDEIENQWSGNIAADIVSVSEEEVPYEKMLETVHANIQTSKFFREAVTQGTSYEHLEESEYREYLVHGLVTHASLQNLFRFYKNYGICSKVSLIGVQKGDSAIRATIKNSAVGASPSSFVSSSLILKRGEALAVKVFEPFVTIHPVLSRSSHIEGIAILAHGSSMTWGLDGGPTAWPDGRRLNYIYEVFSGQEGKSAVPLKENAHSLLIMETFQSNIRTNLAAFKALEVRCKDPKSLGDQEYLLNLTAFNEPDSKLQLPIHLSILLKVACQTPGFLQLTLLKLRNQPRDYLIPKGSEPKYLALRNKKAHDFQVALFDSRSRPFYNSSSVDIKWSLTKSAGSIRPFDNEFFAGTYMLEDQFREANLVEFTGEAVLRAESISYEKQSSVAKTFKEVSDEIRLRALNEVDLEPNYSLLYLSPTASIDVKILYGSGSFTISLNDTSIGTYSYNKATQVITFHPTRIGFVKIEVKDQLLQSSSPAVCELSVVTIQKLALGITNPLIQMGDNTTATVIAYDVFGKEFPESQYSLFEIILDFDLDSPKSSGLALPGRVLSVKENHLQSLIHGEYILVARSNRHSIVSNSAQLFVYSPLKVFPDHLLLSPGCTTFLELLGGPPDRVRAAYRIILTVTSHNSNIIKTLSEEKDGAMVEALSLGETSITARVFSQHFNQVLSNTTVKVNVVEPNGVRLLGSERAIHINAPVRLIIQMTYYQSAMSVANCPYNFTWENKNEQVLQLVDPKRSSNIACLLSSCPTSQLSHTIAANATGIQPGTAEIELTIEVLKKKEPLKISKFVKIVVVEPLTTLIPSYVGQAPRAPYSLLIPPGASYQIPTNRPDGTVLFKIGCSSTPPAFSVTREGRLTNLVHSGKSVIEIEDLSSKDNQVPIEMEVKVAPIHGVFVEDSYRAKLMPKDANSKFTVQLQEKSGRIFPQALIGVEIGVYVTNPDVLSARMTDDGKYLSIYAREFGQSFVMVYVKDQPAQYDVFSVDVARLIEPEGPITIHIGGITTFNVRNLLQGKDSSPRWYSRDENIISVNPITGTALAKSPGSTSIVFDDVIKTETRVTVYSVTSLRMDPSHEIQGFSNMPKHPFFRETTELRFFAYSENVRITNLFEKTDSFSNQLNFRCELSNDAFFSVQEHFSHDQSSSISTMKCLVKPRPVSLGHQGVFPKSLQVKAILESEGEGHFKLEETFHFSLSTGFVPKTPITKVMLDPNQRTHSLEFLSSTPLSVKENNIPSQFIFKSFDPLTSTFRVTISVPESQSSNIYGSLIVENPDYPSLQSNLVQVQYKAHEGDDTTLIGFSSGISLVDVSLLAVLLLSILMLYHCTIGQKL